MNFVVQIWRGDEWRNLTRCWTRKDAVRQLRDWSSHFAGDRLRVWEGA